MDEWDIPSPLVTQRAPDEQRTPPAAERLFGELCAPWDHQIAALDASLAELHRVLRAAERLQMLDKLILRAENTEQLAQRDIDDIARRRSDAISRAVSEVPDQPRLTRKRRIDDARTDAGEWFDEQVERPLGLARSRKRLAEREQLRLLEERRTLMADPLVTDPVAIQFMRQTAAAIEATVLRDREARAEALGDHARLRGTDRRITDLLNEAFPDSAILPGQVFGEGPIHFVAGRKLALVELRRGRDGVRTEEVGGDLRLVQVTPDVDTPMGLTNGSIRQMQLAAGTVERAIGKAPATIICVSGWRRDPQALGELILGGPQQLAQIIGELEDANVTRDDMRAGARALALLDLPDLEVVPVPTLDHLTSVHAEDVPEGLPALRDLIIYAHERRVEAY